MLCYLENFKIYLCYCYSLGKYLWPAFIIFINNSRLEVYLIFLPPSNFPHDYPMRWVGLRESDWLKWRAIVGLCAMGIPCGYNSLWLVSDVLMYSSVPFYNVC